MRTATHTVPLIFKCVRQIGLEPGAKLIFCGMVKKFNGVIVDI